MEQPTESQIRIKAVQFLAWYDDLPVKERAQVRTATAMAEHLHWCTTVPEDCDWSKEYCTFYFDTVKAALIAAGVDP